MIIIVTQTDWNAIQLKNNDLYYISLHRAKPRIPGSAGFQRFTRFANMGPIIIDSRKM